MDFEDYEGKKRSKKKQKQSNGHNGTSRKQLMLMETGTRVQPWDINDPCTI